ncbi:SWI/SNF family DNA-dependent ATPase Ris1 [Rasamsonia emersonii CBS 393.64]|uniref:SWI/SNF family DNA-dependent ATPase Ris1 n=1 Tax=Rasamsonia emersonii (strain ATCC 16479 / CBS 393.64 / IMI 116815) TaxID=1408163 RepID=A0A0F4YPF8_RASE3|nr:SWI/SNF family DNA-dependent ATPase Ris1 [Rasamsonia emersonii CBS 393.64]KKA19995.1 SWI/SNF family DNA-dependent ATPase Ris1 [Rasamsonia emersonii CBS 393.64]
MEDLQLHQALLQSLIESRPGAVEEREELQETIRQLERKLARCRGESSRPSSSRTATSTPVVSQLDGPSDGREESPPFWGNIWGSVNDIDTTSTVLRRSPSHQSYRSSSPDFSRFPQSLHSRKRSHRSAALGEPSGPSSKRITSFESRPSTPSASSVHSLGERPGSLDGSTEELQRLLGFDSRDTLLAMQREQMEAERWLEERKEQERRDAEYARALQEWWHESSRPSSASSSGPGYGGQSGSGTMPPPPGPARDYSGFPTTGDRSLPPTTQPPFTPSFRRSFMGSHQLNSLPAPSTSTPDSSDSDVAEISPLDFHRSVQRVSMGPPPRPNTNYSWLNAGSRGEETILAGGRTSFPSTFPRSLGESSSTAITNRYNSVQETGQLKPQASSTYQQDPYMNGLDKLNAGKSLYNNFPDSPLSSIGPTCGDPFASLGYDLPAWARYRELYPSYLSDYDNKKTTEEIKELLENLRADAEIPKESREGTPEPLKYPLLEHQKLGLTWMKSMEEGKNKGGILADDMGLGKTIQALALMVSRPSSDPNRKTNLIVAPVALMQQWKREITRMLKPGRHQLSVYVLHGEKRGVDFTYLKKFDVVLTTFGTLASELRRKEEWLQTQQAAAHTSSNITAEQFGLPVLGPKSAWYRVIIDEAQCIKNRNTKAAVACCSINAIYRWCMSGTPMMNNVTELHSLLKFLRIRPYSDLEQFNKDFTKPLKVGDERVHQKALQQLQVLLKAVLLRRTKTSKIDGRPILQLPPRITEEVHAVFSEDEQAFYDALENKTQLQFNKYLNAGTIGRNYSNILVLLLRLRQACCHPHLIHDFAVDVSAATGEIDLIANAKAFSADVVQRLKENEPLECPVCIDGVENPVIFFPCGHSTCAECFARISDPALAIQQGNNDGTVEVKCPNCRTKIDPKKVTDNASFKKVHFPDTVEGEQDDADDDDSDEKSDSDDDSGSLSDFIVPDDYIDEPAESSSKGKKKDKKGKGKERSKPKKTLAMLKKEAQKNAAAKRKYLRRLQKNWASSAKVDKTMELLQKIQDAGEGEKTIIFSQFTALLDLLEVPIMRKGWGYRRYDGSMKPADRNNAVAEFTDNPDCKIMLVSLKAGNSGLNLVAASQVIIFDPFWNPYIEDQAVDRAHRIGQTRPVRVHRILVKKTVEDRILALQEKKRELIEGALDEAAGKRVSRLGERELKFLFVWKPSLFF